MRLFGSLKELVRIAWRVDNQLVNLDPSSTTTYTAERTHELPPGDSNQVLVSASSSQTLSNKTLDNSTVATIQDSNLTIQDNGDNTKQLKFEASGISAGQTRTLTAPDASTTLVGTDATQTLTNKTIVAANNTISGLLHGTQVDNPSSGIHGVTGSVVGTTDTQSLSNKTLGNSNAITVLDSSLVIQDNSDPTKQAQFQASSITAGQTRTYTLPDASTTVVGTDATQTLTNKTLTGSLVSDYVDSTEAAAPATPASGTVRVYAKTDGKMYFKDDAGVETGMFGGGGSSESVSTQTNTDYTILDGDGFTTILVSTGNTTRTITLPTVGDNSNRRIRIKKIDSGTGYVTVAGEGAETIDGSSTKRLTDQYDFIVVQANNPGTTWSIVDIGGSIYGSIRIRNAAGFGGADNKIRVFDTVEQNIGQSIVYAAGSTGGGGAGSTFTIQRDGIYSVSYYDRNSAGDSAVGLSLNSNQLTTNIRSITAANNLITNQTASTAGGTVTVCLKFVVGDVIRAHTDGSQNATSPDVGISIAQVSKL